MARHPSTEGNDLSPARVDAQIDVTVPNPAGGRASLAGAINDGLAVEVEITEQLALLRSSEGFAPEFYG